MKNCYIFLEEQKFYDEIDDYWAIKTGQENLAERT